MTKEEFAVLAAEALSDTAEEMEKNCKEVPELNGYYFWQKQRGGKSVLFNGDGERLRATSSVSFERHLDAFKQGRRN